MGEVSTLKIAMENQIHRFHYFSLTDSFSGVLEGTLTTKLHLLHFSKAQDSIIDHAPSIDFVMDNKPSLPFTPGSFCVEDRVSRSSEALKMCRKTNFYAPYSTLLLTTSKSFFFCIL